MSMRRDLLRSCLAGFLTLAAAGCGGSAALRAAEAGRFGDLGRALAEELQRGDLDDEEVRSIARAVAAGEIARAAPPRGAERLRELRSCARHVEDVLAERAAGADAIAPIAAMILLDAGLADAEETKERAALMEAGPSALSGAYRAVHARALVGSGDGPKRRERMVDGDQEVRIAALRAAAAVADPRDREAVLDVARLDPYPLARTLAIRAAAALGGEAVVLALRDVWVLADDPAREAIADAWAASRAVDAGGRKHLLWTIATQRSAPAIAAARALSAAGAAGAADAIEVLTRAIESGPTKDRVYAIHAAPVAEASVRAALTKAQDDPDEAVVLAALERWLEPTVEAARAPGVRAAAAARLLKIAQGTTTRALLAKGALARAGVREVVPVLARDVRSSDDRLRGAAGVALAGMGERARAAPLLADPEPGVRTSVACAILSGP